SAEGPIVIESANVRHICEVAVAEFATVHRDAHIAVAAVLDLEFAITVSAILDAHVAVALIGNADITITVTTVLSALHALSLAVATLMRLKIGEASGIGAALDVGISAAL